VNRKLRKFQRLIEALELLPSVGKKSATRMAFHMVLKNPMDAMKIAHAIEDAVSSLHRCKQCGGLSEDELCYICSDEMRDRSQLCIVENAKDIYIIEESGEYHGLYFVFEELGSTVIDNLKALLDKEPVEEIIFAFTPSIQHDALILYIEDQLQDRQLRFSKIAQGVPTGVELENVDTLSLSKALHERVKI